MHTYMDCLKFRQHKPRFSQGWKACMRWSMGKNWKFGWQKCRLIQMQVRCFEHQPHPSFLCSDRGDCFAVLGTSSRIRFLLWMCCPSAYRRQKERPRSLIKREGSNWRRLAYCRSESRTTQLEFAFPIQAPWPVAASPLCGASQPSTEPHPPLLLPPPRSHLHLPPFRHPWSRRCRSSACKISWRRVSTWGTGQSCGTRQWHHIC